MFEDQNNLVEINSPNNFSIMEDKAMTIHFYGVPDYYYNVMVQDDLSHILFEEEIKPQNNIFEYKREISLEKIPSTLHGKVVVSARMSSQKDENAWYKEHNIAFQKNSIDWLTLNTPSPYLSILVGEELVITGRVEDPSDKIYYSVSDGAHDLSKGTIQIKQDRTFQAHITINQLPTNHLKKATLALEDENNKSFLLDFFIKEKS